MASETLTRGVLPRVQWGPVITGVLCAVAAQIVLGLFGTAFGFAARPGGAGLGVLAGIWSVLAPIAASFVGAWVAVRIAGDRSEAGAFLHGALVWCIGLIAGALFITSTLASGAMTAGTAASGNVAAQSIFRSDTPTGRARAQGAADDAAKAAAAATGAAAVSALLGLGGALLGAAVAMREVTGQGVSLRRSRTPSREERGGTDVEHAELTRPPVVTPAATHRPEEDVRH